MHVSVGERIVVRGPHVGSAERHGEVIDVRGEEGAPPYVVRWDDGHEGLIYPGPDAQIEKQRAESR